MPYDEIMKILGKQLQLLSERSEKCKSDRALVLLTSAMCQIVQRLLGG